jgi:DNA-directed RNA polymerase specialized sigma subunit
MIWQLVWQFHTRNGDAYGTIEELHSEACCAFVEAYNTYDRTKGAFTTHTYWKVVRQLQTLKRKITTAKIPVELQNEELLPARICRLSELFLDLSDDARLIVSLLVDTPAGLSQVIDEEGRTRTSIRIILRQYLDGRRWPKGRIDQAFTEIQDALAWL